MSFTSPTIRIFRLTLGSDTNTTDPILFNDSTGGNYKDSTEQAPYITSIRKVIPEGIGNNQAAEVPEGNVQPLGVVGTTFEIKGFITDIQANAGVNTFITTLETWKNGAQAILNVWEAGRFGIVDNNDHNNDVAPVGTGVNAVGLIFTEFDKTNDVARNRADFILKFRLSRGIQI